MGESACVAAPDSILPPSPPPPTMVSLVLELLQGVGWCLYYLIEATVKLFIPERLFFKDVSGQIVLITGGGSCIRCLPDLELPSSPGISTRLGMKKQWRCSRRKDYELWGTLWISLTRRPSTMLPSGPRRRSAQLQYSSTMLELCLDRRFSTLLTQELSKHSRSTHSHTSGLSR